MDLWKESEAAEIITDTERHKSSLAYNVNHHLKICNAGLA